jgi:outer membrane protein assembly factor BamD
MRPDLRRVAFVATALCMALAQSEAHAFPKLFKKKNKAPATVPSGEQMRSAEIAAAELLSRARSDEAAGRDSAAMKGYEKIVATYPYTSMAPAAQFRIAAALEKNRKYEKAFEAYQTLITNYRQTPQFSEALDRQFGIAMQSRTEKTGRTLGFKSKIGSEEVVEMLKQVIASAPQGPHAAEAQFEIGRIHEEEEERDQAIAAYKKVVLNYPRSSLAREAQARIGQSYIAKVEEGNRDQSNVVKAREAIEEAQGLFPGGPGDVMGTGVIDDAAAEGAYNTGKFYQKKGNFKAAMIYYSDVLKNPGSPHYEEVRDRVNDMSSRDPKLMDSVKNLALDTRSLAVPAAANLKGKAEYFGPPGPPPKLVTSLRRPEMRNDYVPDTPLEPGDLPAVPGMPDNSLLDPNSLPPPDTTPLDAPMPEAPPALEPPALDPPAPAPAPPVEEKPALPAEEQPKSN